jgi:type I restriction enzyme S subunit
MDLKRAAMHQLFTRGLRGEAQKETAIGRMPESWEVVPLGSLGRVGNGSTPKRSVREYWEGGTFPWLTSAKVYDREILAADQFVTETALLECHLPKIDPGAILMAITGQGKTLGHCAVLGMRATINQHIAYVATDTSRAIPGFIRGYLETQYEYLRQVGSGGGSTKGALTCAFLREMPVPLPTLAEQEAIESILDAIDRKIDLHRKKRAGLDELFKALLHKLMTGEIRVADLDLSALSTKETVTAPA